MDNLTSKILSAFFVLAIGTVSAFASDDIAIGQDNATAVTASENAIDFVKPGKWQSVIEGDAGSGDTMIIFNFKTNGKVEVTKQDSRTNLTELKSWKVKADGIEIESKESDGIKDLNGKILKKVDDETFQMDVNGENILMSKHHSTFAWVHLFGFFLLLVLLNELSRRYKYVSILLYCVIPIAFLPMWMDNGITLWFKWAKLYSPIIATVWFIVVSHTKLGSKNWAKFLVAAILIINIFEAVGQDFSIGFLPNTLNALGGILSIITLSRWKEIGPDNSKERDTLWPGMTLFWIIAYDIWNITFVYLNFPDLVVINIAVLLACTLPAIYIKKGTWLQARAFTLSLFMIYYFTFTPFVNANMIAAPRNYTLMLVMGALSFGANFIYAVLFFRWKLTKKSPANLEVGQNAIAYHN
ncbi:MAG: hypothetical protein ACI86X_000534 [Moritella sp.]|jgi:hypothetical protein